MVAVLLRCAKGTGIYFVLYSVFYPDVLVFHRESLIHYEYGEPDLHYILPHAGPE